MINECVAEKMPSSFSHMQTYQNEGIFDRNTKMSEKFIADAKNFGLKFIHATSEKDAEAKISEYFA